MKPIFNVNPCENRFQTLSRLYRYYQVRYGLEGKFLLDINEINELTEGSFFLGYSLLNEESFGPPTLFKKAKNYAEITTVISVCISKGAGTIKFTDCYITLYYESTLSTLSIEPFTFYGPKNSTKS